MQTNTTQTVSTTTRWLFVVLLLNALSLGYVSAQCDQLLFVEYGEGSSFDKWVTILNPTEGDVNLAGCQVWVYNNGANKTTIAANRKPVYLDQIAASLEARESLVLCNPKLVASNEGCGESACSVSTTTIDHNGDDAVTLEDAVGTIIDSIGVVGTREKWDVGGGNTENAVLTRATPYAKPNGEFQVSEWSAESVAADTPIPFSCPVSTGVKEGNTDEPTITDGSQGDDNAIGLPIIVSGGVGAALFIAVAAVLVVRRNRAIKDRAVPGFLPGDQSLAKASFISSRMRNPAPMNHNKFADELDHGIPIAQKYTSSSFSSSFNSMPGRRNKGSDDLKYVVNPPTLLHSNSGPPVVPRRNKKYPSGKKPRNRGYPKPRTSSEDILFNVV